MIDVTKEYSISELKKELTDLLFRQDSSEKALELIDVCERSTHELSKSIKDLIESIDDTQNYVDEKNYFRSKVLIGNIMRKTYEILDFSNVCSYSLYTAAKSECSEDLQNRLKGLNTFISFELREYKRAFMDKISPLYDEYKDMEADFLIDQYLENKN